MSGSELRLAGLVHALKTRVQIGQTWNVVQLANEVRQHFTIEWFRRPLVVPGELAQLRAEDLRQPNSAQISVKRRGRELDRRFVPLKRCGRSKDVGQQVMPRRNFTAGSSRIFPITP